MVRAEMRAVIKLILLVSLLQCSCAAAKATKISVKCSEGCSKVESTKVRVEQGWLRGQILVSSTGMGTYYSFKGIPYAAPPVGKLRFRAPQPPLQWNGTRNALEHGSICIQRATLTSLNTVIGSEDCLFLNVYTPEIDLARPLPVMVFIHEGLFVTGSGNVNQYAPDFLMSYGIVLVTINYRLDCIGFLSANTEEVPGNAGLKDQIAALKWVKRNIRSFGGDPNHVTLFGHSAGGSSVSLHILSPAARGLFRRAIAMSGVYLNDFYVGFEPRRRAFALGRKLGLDTDDPYELIKYLQTLPADMLVKEHPEILLSDKASASVLTTFYFTPIVEKKFGSGGGQYLTEQPSYLMCKCQASPVDFMVSHTAQEGSVVLPFIEDNIFKYYPEYKELLVPLKISNYRSPMEVLKLADRIQSFYFGNQSISVSTIKEFVNYYSESHFVYDIYAYVEKLPKLPSTRRYFFQFSVYSSRNVFSKPAAEKYGIRQATHKDDLAYLFDGTSYNLTVEVNGEAFKYVRLMCTLYTNFAKYGTPTPDNSLGFIWPEYDPHRTIVDIGKTGKFTTYNVSYKPNTSVGFWHNLYRSTGINL